MRRHSPEKTRRGRYTGAMEDLENGQEECLLKVCRHMYFHDFYSLGALARVRMTYWKSGHADYGLNDRSDGVVPSLTWIAAHSTRIMIPLAGTRCITSLVTKAALCSTGSDMMANSCSRAQPQLGNASNWIIHSRALLSWILHHEKNTIDQTFQLQLLERQLHSRNHHPCIVIHSIQSSNLHQLESSRS